MSTVQLVHASRATLVVEVIGFEGSKRRPKASVRWGVAGVYTLCLETGVLERTPWRVCTDAALKNLRQQHREATRGGQ